MDSSDTTSLNCVTANDDDHCAVCGSTDDDLMLCDFCPKAYHDSCLKEDDKTEIAARWCCPECKIENDMTKTCPKCNAEPADSGVFKCINCNQSIHKSCFIDYLPPSNDKSDICMKCQTEPLGYPVEKIVNWRYSNRKTESKEYLLKYSKYAYYQCDWKPVKLVYFDAPALMKEFEAKCKKNGNEPERFFKEYDKKGTKKQYEKYYQYGIKPDWITPERILFETDFEEYVVKWKSLPYSQCTYENQSTPVDLTQVIENYNDLRRRKKKHYTFCSKNYFKQELENIFGNDMPESRYDNSPFYEIPHNMIQKLPTYFESIYDPTVDISCVILIENEQFNEVMTNFQNAPGLMEKLYVVMFHGSKQDIETILDFEIFATSIKNDRRTKTKFDILLINKSDYETYQSKLSRCRIGLFLICKQNLSEQSFHDDENLADAPMVKDEKLFESEEITPEQSLHEDENLPDEHIMKDKKLHESEEENLILHLCNFGLCAKGKVDQSKESALKNVLSQIGTGGDQSWISIARMNIMAMSLVENLISCTKQEDIQHFIINDYGITNYRSLVASNKKWNSKCDFEFIQAIYEFGIIEAVKEISSLTKPFPNLNLALNVYEKQSDKYNFVDSYFNLIMAAILYQYKAKMICVENRNKIYDNIEEFKREVINSDSDLTDACSTLYSTDFDEYYEYMPHIR